MANHLSHERQVIAFRCLLEGMSVRAAARVIGCVHQTLLRQVGHAGGWAAHYCDETLRDLPCSRLEVDELWSFVYAKAKNSPKAKRAPERAGDAWLWVAFCPDTKLVPSRRIGDRTAVTGTEFMKDLASRLSGRVQLTSDGHRAYLEAVEEAFEGEVDYAMLQKVYAPEELALEADLICGQPDLSAISTSGVERQNLTLRMSQRRFTCKTNGFSKKLLNHAHAAAMHYLYYNFCRVHLSLGTTPAVAADVADRPYDLDWFVEQVMAAWPKPKRPKFYRTSPHNAV